MHFHVLPRIDGDGLCQLGKSGAMIEKDVRRRRAVYFKIFSVIVEDCWVKRFLFLLPVGYILGCLLVLCVFSRIQAFTLISVILMIEPRKQKQFCCRPALMQPPSETAEVHVGRRDDDRKDDCGVAGLPSQQ